MQHVTTYWTMDYKNY